jgi:uncharacterized membrane protein HdeD (DUF308 family)
MTRNRTNVIGVIIGIAFVMSGVAGITVGGTSAQAGWWLVIVGGTIGAAAIVGLIRGRTAVPRQ